MFDALFGSVEIYLVTRQIFVRDCYAGADESVGVPTTVEVRLRANEWLFQSSGVNSLEARFDVSDKTSGSYKLDVKPTLADLPFGVH